jgi:hypothetical protein
MTNRFNYNPNFVTSFKPKINKMKTFLAGLVLLLSSTLYAQPRNEISVGFGPSFFGWGDVYGAALTGTYNYRFAKHFGVEPGIISSVAWKLSDNSNNSGTGYISGNNYSQTGYIGAAASLVYTPFAVKGNFFKLKSGFLMSTMTHSKGANLTGSYPVMYSEFEKQNLFGLIHTVHIRILNKEKIFVGTELSMLTSFSEGYYNCDGFVWNFMGGIKF